MLGCQQWSSEPEVEQGSKSDLGVGLWHSHALKSTELMRPGVLAIFIRHNPYLQLSYPFRV